MHTCRCYTLQSPTSSTTSPDPVHVQSLQRNLHCHHASKERPSPPSITSIQSPLCTHSSPPSSRLPSATLSQQAHSRTDLTILLLLLLLHTCTLISHPWVRDDQRISAVVRLDLVFDFFDLCLFDFLHGALFFAATFDVFFVGGYGSTGAYSSRVVRRRCDVQAQLQYDYLHGYMFMSDVVPLFTLPPTNERIEGYFRPSPQSAD